MIGAVKELMHKNIHCSQCLAEESTAETCMLQLCQEVCAVMMLICCCCWWLSSASAQQRQPVLGILNVLDAVAHKK